MNIEDVRSYCLSLRGTTECFPFDDVSLVFKVENKMYLLLPLDADEPHVSLKCSTDYTEELREETEIKRWIHHSYREVIAKLPKSLREEYKENP